MIERIASPDDARLEAYRRVGQPRWLLEQNLFVAEGRLVVERLIELRRHEIASALVTPAALDALHRHLATAEFDVYVCDRQTLYGITGFNFHRGCLALAYRPAPLPVEALMQERLLVGLEAVGNPDNVGGLFRTAAAFGAGGIVLDRSSGDPLYRKAIRTSMGASLRIPFAAVDSWPASIERVRRSGFQIVALTPAQDAAPIAEYASSSASRGTRLLVLLGAEGSGLAEATLAGADARVRIPIAPTVDSLNVVVAAGIALERLTATRASSPPRDRPPRPGARETSRRTAPQ
jgi:tRNA G18 (ribose-2'-O)-methylase SpoU